MCSFGFCIASVFVIIAMLITTMHRERTEYLNYKYRVNFWNRELSHATRRKSSNVINWIPPDSSLPAPEYLMAVEMVKGNHCSIFTLDEVESRKNFCQCMHLFPSLRKVYNRDFLTKTKMEIDEVCPKIP